MNLILEILEVNVKVKFVVMGAMGNITLNFHWISEQTTWKSQTRLTAKISVPQKCPRPPFFQIPRPRFTTAINRSCKWRLKNNNKIILLLITTTTTTPSTATTTTTFTKWWWWRRQRQWWWIKQRTSTLLQGSRMFYHWNQFVEIALFY